MFTRFLGPHTNMLGVLLGQNSCRAGQGYGLAHYELIRQGEQALCYASNSGLIDLVPTMKIREQFLQI